MSFIEKITNSIQYQIYKATSDPKADKFAKEMAEKDKRDEAAKASAEYTQALKDKNLEKKKAENDKKEEEKKAAEERAKFSFSRLFGTVFGTFLTIFLIFLLFFSAVLGSSMATNLNLYRSLPFRIFYAIYGFVFFFLVIPYVLGYRWFWKGHKPKFYSLIPIIPYHLDNRFTAFLFSWLSYKPDDQIDSLKEWIKEKGE